MTNSSCTDRAQRAAIYRKAAEQIVAYRHKTFMLPSCWALARSGGDADTRRWYKNTMLNGQVDVTLLWGAGHEYSKATNDVRVLLLCFAAAITERP